MAAGSTDVVIRFLSDMSDMKDSVGRMSDHFDGMAGKLKKAAIGVGIAVGGAFAVDQIGDFIDAAEESDVAVARLEQTLQNAGDTTGEWAKHANDLADTLMKRTGIDDEVIKGGQAILATFHDVSGATGQMSGAFDRATALALDMSKTGFGDVNSAATMLGKALQDPEKGITALGRVGITFSEDQKKAIKAMVDSGDKAGAMGLIMDNVQGQVGGVAEATVTASDKLAVSVGEMQESIGKALLPLFQAVAPILRKIADWVGENAAAWGEKLEPIMRSVGDWIRDNLLPALAKIPDVFAAIGDWIARNKGAFVAFAAPFVVIGAAIAKLVPYVIDLAVAVGTKLAPVFEAIGKWLSDHEDIWTALAIGVIAAGTAILVTLVPAFIAWAGAAIAAGIATLFAIWPFLLIGAAVAALAYLIITNWDTIKSVTLAVWDAITTAVSWAWDNVLKPVFEAIKTSFEIQVNTIKWLWENVLRPVWDAITAAVSWAWDNVLKPTYEKWANQVAVTFGAIKWLWDNVLKPVWDAISSTVSWVWTWVVKPAYEGMKIEFTTMANAVKWVWDNVLKPVWDAISSTVSWVWEHVIKPAYEGMKIEFAAYAAAVKWLWDNVLKPVWDAIKETAQWIADKLEWLIDKANTAKSAIEKIPGVGLIPGLAEGGIVTRPTLAMIGERGPEAVIPLSHAGGAAAGGNVTINVTTSGLGADAPAIQSAVVAALRGYTTRNGPLPSSMVG